MNENSQWPDSVNVPTKKNGMIGAVFSGSILYSFALFVWLWNGNVIQTMIMAAWVTPVFVVLLLDVRNKPRKKNGFVDLVFVGTFLYFPVLLAWLQGSTVSGIILTAVAVSPMFLFMLMIVLMFGSFFP